VEMCNGIRAVLQPMDPTLGIVLGGALSLGFTPDVAPGFFVAGELHWRRKEHWGFHLALEPRVFLPSQVALSPSGKPVYITFFDVAAVPCARYKWVLGCAFVDMGATFLSGPSLEGTGSNGLSLFMFGLGPRLAVDIPITERFGVRAFGDVRFLPLPPVSYKYGPLGAIWTDPLVSGFVGLGISFH
jgi:hypothetical protein